MSRLKQNPESQTGMVEKEGRPGTNHSVADSLSHLAEKMGFNVLPSDQPVLKRNIHIFDAQNQQTLLEAPPQNKTSAEQQNPDNFQQQDYQQQRSKCPPFTKTKLMNQADHLRLQQAMIKSEHRSPSGNFEQHLSQAQKRCFFTDATPKKPLTNTFAGPIGGAVYKNHNGTFLKQADRSDNDSTLQNGGSPPQNGTYDQLSKYNAPLKRRSKRINAQARNAETFMNNAAMLQQSQLTSKQSEIARQKQKVRLLEVLPQTFQQRGAPRTAGGHAATVNNQQQNGQFTPLPLDQPATSSGMRSPPNERVQNLRLGTGQASTQKAVARILNSTTGLAQAQPPMVPIPKVDVQNNKHKKQHQKDHNRVRSIPTPQSASRQQSYNVLPNQVAGDQLGLKAGQMATPVLVPASALFQGKNFNLANSLGMSNDQARMGLPTNGYLLGYINPTQAGPQSQVLIPALAAQHPGLQGGQSLQACQPEFFRSKKQVRQSLAANEQVYHKQNSASPQQSNQRRYNPEKYSPQQNPNPLSEDSITKMKLANGNWDYQCSQESASEEDSIAIKGTGVSLQLDRSPTELLKRVVRLRSQQQHNPKGSPTQKQQVVVNQSNGNQNSQSPPSSHQSIFGHQLMPQNQIMIPASYLKTLYNQSSSGSVAVEQVSQTHHHHAQSTMNQRGQPLTAGSQRFAHQLMPATQQHASIHNSFDQVQPSSPKTLVFLAVVQQGSKGDGSLPDGIETGERRQIYENIRRQNNQWLAANNFYPGQYSSMTSQPRAQQSLSLGVQGRNRAEWRPPSRSGSNTRNRLKSQQDLHHEAKGEEKPNPYLKEGVIRPPRRDEFLHPSQIVQMFKPPSAIRLQKECEKFEKMLQTASENPQTDVWGQKSPEEKKPESRCTRRKALKGNQLCMNLKDHPINIVLKRGNEFINETFLKSSDNKIDLKKVQALCNFFRIALPYRVNWDQHKLKSREFLINAKERILICLYETINKENGMIRPDMPTTVTAQRWSEGIDQQPTSNFAMPTNSSASKDMREDRGAEQKPESQFSVNPYVPNQRKFYVARGNNHAIVRIVFKQRWWWQMTRQSTNYNPNFDFTQNNFLWTQWCQQPLTKQLPTFAQKAAHDAQTPFPNSPVNKVDEKDGKPITKEQLVLTSNQLRLYGKMEDDYHLTNKKALFWNMMHYYQRLGHKPFENLPVTFHIEHGVNDPEYLKFKNYFLRFDIEIKRRRAALAASVDEARKRLRQMRQKEQQNSPGSPSKLYAQQQERYLFETYDPDNLTYFEDEHVQAKYGIHVGRNIWILKPGENSNRGCGIIVCQTLSDVTNQIQNDARKGHTSIIQKYIDRPLLFAGRKFDIRMFAVLSSVNSNMRGYFYNDGYLRTSSKEFSLDNLSARYVHLTNDAIQQTSEEYGRFESGNKISFQQFQRYLEHAYPNQKINFTRDLLPQMKRLVTDSFQATFAKIDPHRRQHSFEILGYDFMIDSNFKVYIIECNTNPSLELCCPLMARIVPAMLDNVFRMVVDPLFPPPDFSMAKKNLMHDIFPLNKLDLVFDERLSGPPLRALFKNEPQLNLRIEDEGPAPREEEEYASDSNEDELEELGQVAEDIFVESASGGSARSQ